MEDQEIVICGNGTASIIKAKRWIATERLLPDPSAVSPYRDWREMFSFQQDDED